jgi:hypothetical protein
MTGRPHYAEGVSCAPLDYRVYGIQDAAHSLERDIQ